jgi:hypothetical protein
VQHVADQGGVCCRRCCCGVSSERAADGLVSGGTVGLLHTLVLCPCAQAYQRIGAASMKGWRVCKARSQQLLVLL